MSCIGKYPRNAIGRKTTFRLSLFFFAMAPVGLLCNFLFSTFEVALGPETIFYLSSVYWLTLNELPFLVLIVFLSTRDTPYLKEAQRNTKFYILRPSFVPRIQCLMAEKPFTSLSSIKPLTIHVQPDTIELASDQHPDYIDNLTAIESILSSPQIGLKKERLKRNTVLGEIKGRGRNINFGQGLSSIHGEGSRGFDDFVPL